MSKFERYLLLFLSLLLTPSIVFANSDFDSVPLGVALGVEAFVTIHMSLFVLSPLAKILSKEDSKKTFWILFTIRILVLLIFDFFITPIIFFVDFMSVFIGAFIIVPIAASIKKVPLNGNRNQVLKVTSIPNAQSNIMQSQNQQTVVRKCKKCGKILNISDKYCGNCGVHIEGDDIIATMQKKVFVNPSNFDKIYMQSEDELLEDFIKREIARAGIANDNKLMTEESLKRKNIINGIFSVLLFLYISLLFFHFPVYTYGIGIILLAIFFISTRRYNLMKYLKKEVKARPTEKISNIVMNVEKSLVRDNANRIRIACIIAACIIPLFIFGEPKIIYEKVEGGYAVRFYTFGLSNFKTATIPETYRDKKVVSLRGNTFSNMPFLKSVSLPNTITEIRGQAFKNDCSLISVNIPTKLEYLGGGAFYNCSSIKSIMLPDSLTYMGGETFYGASSLEYIKLSSNLTEIRGDSFEYCTSLESISIPDNVTRIGGHAFYGDTSLSEVYFTTNSKLNEIGSSAFRQCKSLHSITIPNGVYINERAFKESPTIINYFDSYNYYDYNY